jgi:hypothetical protein
MIAACSKWALERIYVQYWLNLAESKPLRVLLRMPALIAVR